MAGTATAQPPGGPKTVLFADHIEAKGMGEYVREFRFVEPVVLHSVQIVDRPKRPIPDLPSFEGRTFPDVRTMSLSVYASDRKSSSSTMSRMRAGDAPGTFLATEGMVVDAVTIRGEYLRLSVVIYGQALPSEAAVPEQVEMPGVAAHLRASCAFDAERLDLADIEVEDDELEGLPDASVDAGAVADSGAPASLARALSISTRREANDRVADHADWVQLCADQPDVLEADAVAKRLEDLVGDLVQLARGSPDASAAHVSYGPVLARALLKLVSRCMDRLEFRPLRTALRALAASLCAAPTAAEVLKNHGLMQLVTILRETEWSQLGTKLAALQALLQLCTHAVGMEAFLGWSSGADAATTVPSYEAVVAIALDGAPGTLERTAVVLLQRSGFYMALARLDGSCARLSGGDDKGDGEASGDDATRGVIDALHDVASQLWELSRSPADICLLGGCPSPFNSDGPPGDLAALAGVEAEGAGSDPFAQAHPQLGGFLESFASGRRLVPSLCALLRRFPRLPQRDRLAAFVPLRRLVCTLLSCVGGAHFLAQDATTYSTFLNLLDGDGGAAGKGGKGVARDAGCLPPVPRFPEQLARSAVGAPQLAALVSMHVRAARLVLLLLARTRQKGQGGLLAESEALPLLTALHQLCAKSSAGRDSVVCAFRSLLTVEWLLRQAEGRLDEVAPPGAVQAAAAAAPARPSLRHLIAVLHALVLGDAAACVAEKFGSRVLALASRALELLEAGAASVDGAEGGNKSGASLEFALDSAGAEGGLGRAVREGRRSADTACLVQLRELVAQLRPWQRAEGEQPVTGAVPTSKLLACLQLSKAPRDFKRSTNEERPGRPPLVLGGYCAAGAVGVEVPEVNFIGSGEGGEHGEPVDDRERYPPGDLTQLPLLAMRLLRRRAAAGPREALAIVLGSEKAPAKDGLAVLVPVLVRCAGALSLNLEALMLREHDEAVDAIYATQHAHCQLLEAALQTCCHLLCALRDSGLTQYRHTELMHALVLLAVRLSSSPVGTAPQLGGADPEFRLLRRHCLVLTCRVFRVWVQGFPRVTGGQLLRPLLRHMRVLPCHFVPGLLLLSTCGSLRPTLPAAPHKFEIISGELPERGEHALPSQQLLLPASTHGGAPGSLVLRANPQEPDGDRGGPYGQLWATDHQDRDWDSSEAGAAHMRDPLIEVLSNRRQTANMAAALSLVNRVNARRERLSIDDIAELTALAVQCSITADALLHLINVRVLERLERIGVPALERVLKLGEAALQGASAGSGTDGETVYDSPSGGPARDARDGRAVSRVLMLLARYGSRGAAARRTLAEGGAETLCLAVLAHNNPGALPPMAGAQAIRVLSLIFCCGNDASISGIDTVGSINAQDGATPSRPPKAPSPAKCRMVSKALTVLLNRTPGDGPVAGPAALAAALELLLRLSSARSMCLNLLFNATGDQTPEESAAGSAIPVTVSCAFRLAQCTRRLAQELGSADERWVATVRGSEDETEAEEVLGQWLHVGELLGNLCQTVLVNCPTASVFLAVMLPGDGKPPEEVNEAMLKNVLADVSAVLIRITGRSQRADSVPLRAAELVGNLRALQRQLLDTKQGPPPETLAREELCPPRHGGAAAEPTAAAGQATAGADGCAVGGEAAVDDGADAMTEIVALFDEAADVEADPEWHAVAELDSADSPPERLDWEFDAAVLRRKRQAVLEKAESDRRAKRQKQALRAEQDAKTRRRDDEARGDKDGKQAKRDGGNHSTAAAAAPAAPTAPAPAAAGAIVPVAAAPDAGAKPAAKPATGAAQASEAAMLKFLKDHPHLMRVLQDPKKLNDPRVKSMFLSELENYPQVKAYLEKKGLKLG